MNKISLDLSRERREVELFNFGRVKSANCIVDEKDSLFNFLVLIFFSTTIIIL